MVKRPQNPRAIYVALCLALVALCALAVVAQSGRRERKPESSSVPVPTPEATPTSTSTPTEKPKPTLTFIVALDRNADILMMPQSTYGSVLRNCAERLGDSRAVSAEVGSKDMSRSDAVRQAKAEKETYIVWLQLLRETARDGTTDYIYIQYTVFAPTTAKQVTFGSIFPEAYRNKRVTVPTSTNDGDYYLNQAARGAAERILDHFHLRPQKALP